MVALEIIFLIVAIIIIILSLLQGGKSDGASSSIMGGMGNKSFTDLKERGVEKALSIITFFLAGAFFLLAIIVRIVEKTL
ncbi:MAG: preprotein translocase subunit SecG [Bacilli bacterium]|nr:preprotein translocase subunit SecG [Bacilli bacterium]MDD4065768.1 preprotein translocase subunit SecG [Bacilli bacterium]MDD4066336.1 preprotein translocase subunit SecG [Bacilli bacterium]